VRASPRGPLLLAAGVLAVAVSVGLLAVALAADDKFTRALARCSETATMPGYALPAGIGSVLLMTGAVVLGLLARRERPAPDAEPWWRVTGGLLAVVAVGGVLVTAYFGVVVVLMDMGDKQHCFG